jgi:HD-GYP domain-containing protein (c-di-GMP phosphodiesterase class II)
MTSDRSYRRAMPVGEAVAELRRCAGSQFDPRVVEAFCAQLASGSLSDGRPEPTTSHVAERNAVAAS